MCEWQGDPTSILIMIQCIENSGVSQYLSKYSISTQLDTYLVWGCPRDRAYHWVVHVLVGGVGPPKNKQKTTVNYKFVANKQKDITD